MEHKQYVEVWAAVKPAMQAKLASIANALSECLPRGLNVDAPFVDEACDEFKVVLNVKQADTTVLGMDFTLVDAGMRDDEEGVNVSLPIIGPGGLVLGGYYPLNWTSEVWTSDVDEIERRVAALDVGSFVAMIMTECLTNPQLRADLTAVGVDLVQA